jgi:hypothetical protein
MQFSSLVTIALLPLLAAANTSTLTSYLTMTKTITIERVATSTAYNTTSAYYLPTGSTVLASTTTVGGASKTTSSTVVSPTINAAMSLNAATVAAAGVAGMVMAAFM